MVTDQHLQNLNGSSRAAESGGGKPVFGEGSMKTTMETKKSSEGTQWSQYVQSRYRKVISLPFPSMTAASVHTVGHGCRVPLLRVKNQKGRGGPLETGFDTHTHTPPTWRGEAFLEGTVKKKKTQGSKRHSEP